MVEFLTKNYVWFLIIAVLLIFALSGLLIEYNSKKEKKTKIDKVKKEKEDLMTIANSGLSLGDAVVKHDEEDVKIEEVPVEEQSLIVDEPE